MLSEKDLTALFILMRRPIPWDPVPFRIKLTAEQIKKFNAVQAQWNAKIDELDRKKVEELTKICGV